MHLRNCSVNMLKLTIKLYLIFKYLRINAKTLRYGSPLSIVTGCRMDGWSQILTATSRPVLGFTQPPIPWVPGALSLTLKRPGR